MLVLTRRVGASIVLGDGIEIEVLDVRGGAVRLGVKAPRSVRVLRGELVADVAAANAEAAAAAAAAAATGTAGGGVLAGLRPVPQPVERPGR